MEFYRLASRNDLEESEDKLIARFTRGLKYSIQDKILVHTIFDLADAINIDERIKKSSTNQFRFALIIRPAQLLQGSSLNRNNFCRALIATFRNLSSITSRGLRFGFA